MCIHSFFGSLIQVIKRNTKFGVSSLGSTTYYEGGWEFDHRIFLPPPPHGAQKWCKIPTLQKMGLQNYFGFQFTTNCTIYEIVWNLLLSIKQNGVGQHYRLVHLAHVEFRPRQLAKHYDNTIVTTYTVLSNIMSARKYPNKFGHCQNVCHISLFF